MKIKSLVFLILSTLLWGCASSLVLETDIDVPQPLMQPLPLNTAIHYPESIREHIYIENTEDRSNWSITTGPSHIELFDQVLQSLFASTTFVDNVSEVGVDYDMLITPSIKDIQFALPSETGFSLYEVWIDYELAVEQPNGGQITTLNFTGYGSSPQSFFTRESKGLLTAANAAFRELGAQTIVNFIKDKDIQKWLAAKSSAPQESKNEAM
ncbi:MAG: hypothetical protein AAGJ37_04510 [Pseudomonadota bacterium]